MRFTTCTSREGFIRILGVGATWKPRDADALFSERNGYAWWFRIGSRRVRFLWWFN